MFGMPLKLSRGIGQERNGSEEVLAVYSFLRCSSHLYESSPVCVPKTTENTQHDGNTLVSANRESHMGLFG